MSEKGREKLFCNTALAYTEEFYSPTFFLNSTKIYFIPVHFDILSLVSWGNLGDRCTEFVTPTTEGTIGDIAYYIWDPLPTQKNSQLTSFSVSFLAHKFAFLKTLTIIHLEVIQNSHTFRSYSGS